MPPPLQTLDARYMRTSAGFQVKMGPDFLMFSHFAAYFLGHPSRNQIDTNDSTHSPNGKGFAQRDSKWPNNIARTAMKKRTTSSEIAMDKLKWETTFKILGPTLVMERKIQQTDQTDHYGGL